MVHENSNIEITGESLQCLRPRAWLNDEVICNVIACYCIKDSAVLLGW